MVNAWSLAASVLDGTIDEDYPIMYGPEDEANYVKWKKENEGKSKYYFDYNRNDPDRENPFTESINLKGAEGDDHLKVSFSDDPYPTVGMVDEVYKHHFPPTKKPQADLDNPTVVRKYQEDRGIKDLTDYIASTYSGHYTNKGSNVQTLDLIQSVGDAESFCRSNAIKYLSRYDKRGQAKRDILKALHYCLLLYYFSGNTNDETPTRGYETF
jgi:hypothetical protein